MKYFLVFVFLCNLTQNFALDQHNLFEKLYGVSKTISSSPWHIESVHWNIKTLVSKTVSLRAGFFKENDQVPFKGNILYLEGLGDSMLNHDPYFKILSDEGYRVISFDYMGQGGSEGSMNDTRLYDKVDKKSISVMAKFIYQRFKRKEGDQKVRLIGWSTGGLASYMLAVEGWADQVVLIAPGLAPKLIVGDKFKITMGTLTSAQYLDNKDPHVDMIKPNSPIKVPFFASNLIATSLVSSKKTIGSHIKGLVFTGGDDRYVFHKRTKRLINKNASHFEIYHYSKAKHEIHNEIKETRLDLYKKTIEFFNSY
ncbi:MAG: alpha/beta fold hydrolase [Candidatus Cloacimonetes bacterium]|nr:alpha/beta fold hydrolase [Candidatus Cloacimonadota bacterium]